MSREDIPPAPVHWVLEPTGNPLAAVSKILFESGGLEAPGAWLPEIGVNPNELKASYQQWACPPSQVDKRPPRPLAANDWLSRLTAS